MLYIKKKKQAGLVEDVRENAQGNFLYWTVGCTYAMF